MFAHETTPEMIAEYDARFASRLKTIRTKQGLSAQALADKCGMDRRAISKIENGSRGVSVGEAVAIADALELRPHEICKPAPVRLSFTALID